MLMNTTKQISIKRINNECSEEILDSIIVEKPLKIFINFELYTVLMCTPSEALELVIGFLFSEDIISSFECIKSIEEKYGDRVCVVLNKDIQVDFDGVKATTSGCGKGSVKFKFIEEGGIKPIESYYKFTSESILKFMKEFNSKSELFKQTGGVHSSCICGEDGIDLFSEDIGRHNALDKVIGKALMNNVKLKDKIVMTTGRISSDLIIKAAKSGIPIIVSHSAPTDLALSIAETANLTVIGFVRGHKMNIYCGEERICT
jgi:FdhD protein